MFSLMTINTGGNKMFYVSDLRPTHQHWELPKKKTEPQSSQSNFETRGQISHCFAWWDEKKKNGGGVINLSLFAWERLGFGSKCDSGIPSVLGKLRWCDSKWWGLKAEISHLLNDLSQWPCFIPNSNVCITFTVVSCALVSLFLTNFLLIFLLIIVKDTF